MSTVGVTNARSSTAVVEGTMYNFRSLSSLENRELITISNTSQQGFGITTNAYHISDDPSVLGTLAGTELNLMPGQVKDLYIVGASSDGPGGPGLEHNGTVNALHIRVSIVNDELNIEEIDYLRDHPGPGDWETRTFNSVTPTSPVTNQGGDLMLFFAESLGSNTATLNFQDIDNTRIQWGTFTDMTTGPDTLSFPVPFADNNYSFVATPFRDSSSSISRTIGTGSRLANSIEVRVFFPDGTSPIATDIMWQAIGLKP